LTEVDQFLPVELVDSLEIMDEFGDRLTISGWRSLWANWKYSATEPSHGNKTDRFSAYWTQAQVYKISISSN